MVGIVIVGHCNLAEELYAVLKTIVGTIDHVVPVTFDQGDSPEKSIKKLATAVQKVDSGNGVLILTDMFGGTPSNLSLSLLEDDKVEVLTGVNLPMLVRLITLRKGKNKLNELARDLKSYGQKNICIASEILMQQKS